MQKKKVAKNPGAQSLLIELLTEELPPKALKDLSEAFSDSVEEGLRNRGLLNSNSAVISFATPRRLAVHISSVTSRGADKPVEQKLMPLSVARDTDGKASEALKKKLAITGRAHLAKNFPNATDGPDSLYVKSDGKTESVYLSTLEPGWNLADALNRTLQDAVEELPIPKLMSYPLDDREAPERFVRPARGLLALHGNKVIDVSILGLKSTNLTRGHRFLAKGHVAVPDADKYEEVLKKGGGVIASFAKRKELIHAELEKTAAGAKIVWDDALLDEVTALVEYPAVYPGSFSPEFLVLPQECLILSMKQHQRYFPLANKTGKLLPSFLMVSNLRTANPANIIRGNERVLRARLSDAKFFYDQDRKTRLEARVPRLAPVVYHNKLGSQLERVERIQLLAGKIARDLSADAVLAGRAAWLSKADLLTGMVGEFPELQGVMGRYYAIHDGEPREVADAIEQHYRPRFAADRLPDGPTACAVALADKLDMLAGLFSIGGQPTGDKDPFGLRRAALGVVRIIVENQLPLLLWDLVNAAFEPFKGKAQTDLRMFLIERMRSYFQERGYTANEVEAVLSLHPAEINLVPKQLEAVRAFSALPEAASLAAANKRVVNILKQAEAKGESFINAEADKLQEPAERALFNALKITSQQAASLFKQGDFTGYLKTFAVLKSPVDAFFYSVMVMVDNPALRHNRLALLADLRHAMNRVADISKLAVEK